MFGVFFFFFKQKTAYEMRISDWSSDVCSSDLGRPRSGPADLGAAVARRVSGPVGARAAAAGGVLPVPADAAIAGRDRFRRTAASRRRASRPGDRKSVV